ncbi:hypothetical protein PsorP6_005734 [Peronosclerospora sorghi]|uniref:Uncharacterized protein n=1 Tax=Peronosclerospora sorghi TaxID=230839 RepID=A0ACC0W8K7_9STRA|nr:hypothetical protein PsorP6_005734 [Peronosclerospora sorghi]
MDGRLEVRAWLRTPSSPAPLPPVEQGIALDDTLDEEAFLRLLEEALQQHVAQLETHFLVLSTSQVELLARRLHDALVPKREPDTHVIQAWTIQPQLQRKVKTSAHVQVLKLSTILREVQRLRVHQSEPVVDAPPHVIEVDIFPSLKVMEALNTESTGLAQVHYFSKQLRELHIEHTNATRLSQVLAPGKVSNWWKLIRLHMNCCALELVDESVNLLRAIKTLDLGWNKIETFRSSVTTRSLEVLNLCHNRLRAIPPIQALRGLRELYLAVNRITSLAGLETLTGLERLDLSHNLIDDITELELLMPMSRLTYLKMEFNPIARRPDYRREVLFYLGEPIELDGQRWSDAEVNSMRNRRMLTMLDCVNHVSSGEGNVWGQTETAPVYPRASVRNGFVTKNLKLVLEYPHLSRSQHAPPAQFVEIKNPPSRLKYLSNIVSGGETEGENCSLDSLDTNQDTQTNRPTRTVDDYFRTQRNVISLEKKNGLISPSPYQNSGRKLSARVLLSAKDAAELNVPFQVDGVSANIEIKPRELVERISASNEKDPTIIVRSLSDVVAVGTSLHSKITATKWRPRGSSSVVDAAYQLATSASLQALFSSLVIHLFHQYKGHIDICHCASCGALSLLTLRYPERKQAEEQLIVYSCLLCSSCNVREISFKKLVALCANEDVVIPTSISLAPAPWVAKTEGFYIEEPSATDPATSSNMRECIMVSCNGIREVTPSTVEWHTTSDEIHSD